MVEIIFGEVLRDLRKSRKISQSQLAEKCSLDRTYISMLERGIRQPTISTVFKLAKALDTQPSHLISLVENIYDNKR